MSNLTTIYIARHGETNWNVEGRIQGQTNSSLTEEGKRQARELGVRLNEISFDAVYSSDLTRARDTATLAIHERSLALKTTEALREKNQGRLEGRLRKEVEEELKESYGEARERMTDKEKFNHRTVPDSETLEEVTSRFITFLREVSVAHPGKTVLIVTHGGVMGSFLVHLGFGTFNEIPPKAIKNTAYIIIESDGIDFFLKETQGIEKKQI